MNLSYYITTGLITSTTSFLIGFFAVFKNKKGFLNKAFLFYCFSIGFWVFAWTMMISAKDSSVSMFWNRMVHSAAILIPIFLLHFISIITEIQKKRTIRILYIISFFFLFLAWQSNLFLLKVKPKFIFNFYSEPGLLYPIHLFVMVLVTVYCVVKLFETYKLSQGLKRNQLKYLMVALVIGYVGGFTAYLPVYNIPIPFWTFYGISVCVIVVAYAILRYRLMDIRVAITRAGSFIIVYTLVLGIPFWIGFKFLGRGLWIIPVSVTAFLATLGPFIYLYVDRKAEDRLLKEQRRYQESLKQASIGMTRIRDLKRLLDLITHIVTKTVRISFAAIYLHSAETNEYVLQVSRDKGRTPIPKLVSDNPLIAWITTKRDPLIYEEVKRVAQDTYNSTYRHLEENMRLLTATVIIPCLLDNRLVGFFVLGEKLSGQIYTPEDLNVFQVLASQAALAIENAQFYEEAKEMHEQVAQAEKMATVGTMADGLSHQINNRFYALSLIAGDTVDTIKLTDTSKCAPEIKEMLNQINHALERIQANVIQGGEVVKGILKYTRKGDEGFEALTIDQVLDGALDMVQYKIKLSEIDIVRNYSKDTPKIKGNLVQLQEAFFNFIDNAYDAMVERRGLLKEEDYRGKITISAQPRIGGKLEITVQDNGMGIKDNSLKRVFTPFFTTKASSHKGTGLGLYVIKRIIEENNQGKIRFASEYGQGTSFVIELPLAQG